jgi:hypothetical protein
MCTRPVVECRVVIAHHPPPTLLRQRKKHTSNADAFQLNSALIDSQNIILQVISYWKS